jgi:hypothetical protein
MEKIRIRDKHPRFGIRDKHPGSATLFLGLVIDACYFVGALAEQANHPHWGRVVSYLLNRGRFQPPHRGRDVGDHPPITPMRAAPRDEFTKGNAWKIYDYVTR